MNEEALLVTDLDAGVRLDKFMADCLEDYSRSAVQSMIDEGKVLVNGVSVKKSIKLKGNETVTFTPPPVKELEAIPQNIPVDIIFEDEYLLVVNKPKGMVVHPAPGNPDGTLVNALLYHCKGRLSTINGVVRPGIVHRIDKDTSGLLMVAKTDAAHRGLAEQIKDHSFYREYRAITVGAMKTEEGVIDKPLGRSRSDRKKQAVNGLNPRNAVTHYKVLEHYPGYDYCRFILETGRTHQIRVHCAFLGHPIAGDTVYGGQNNEKGLAGQCLHAKTLGFIHPISGQKMMFTSELPDYFVQFLNKINKN